MISRNDVISMAHACGFGDIGFTTADPFASQKQILQERQEKYAWAMKAGLDLMAGTDPKNILPEARSIIVLIEAYFREGFPPAMERHFGRCYLDDDRVIRDRLSKRIKAFREFLRERGIRSKVPFNLPHRLAAARAGLGTFGKNCLFYSRGVMGRGSWVLPVAVVVDHEFPPDEPTLEIGCPEWCRNVCIAACPKGDIRLAAETDRRGIRVARAGDGERCTACGACYVVCPDVAITVCKATAPGSPNPEG